MNKLLPILSIFSFLFLSSPLPGQVTPSSRTVDPALQKALGQQLQQANSNRENLEIALREIEPEYRESMVFLVQNMPARDLQSVSSKLLLSNVRLAHKAREASPWGKQIPDEIFLNDVLPYANVDEQRENWRKQLRENCLPIVKDCQTPAEAAQRLNEKLFKIVNVKYSTRRKRANQAPSESIEQGLASCTGLSILLTDACRSVCVPARLAGIPSWPNKRGNHTWVEIWDKKWHFTGAAEPDKRGLNHTWFQADAALAKKDSKLNAIYAISFKKTDTVFPAVWSRGENPIYAVNVTDRYTPKQEQPKPQNSLVKIMIRVWDADKKKRIATKVRIRMGRTMKLMGTSPDNEADMNNMLTMEVKPNRDYWLQVGEGDSAMQQEIKVSEKQNQVFDLKLPTQAQPKSMPELSAEELGFTQQELDSLLEGFSSVDAKFELPKSLQEKYIANVPETRQKIWKVFQASKLSQDLLEGYNNKQVRFKEHLSPYIVKEVGTRPKNGWPLFIAMHGGGGAPKRVNDSQWRHMQIYYKDQPDVEGYKYLALRAPNDTWNGFYDDYVYPLIENLIAQMVIHGDVDPNKVYAMGYSHGGYGAFAIGPKIPYRFAAVHSSAAAPTDGQTSAKTLRNTRFTFMVGEKDTAYGRADRCQKFWEQIQKLQKEHPGEYPVAFFFKEGFGHGGLPDRNMIKQMYDYTRESMPKSLTWEQTDSVVNNFFWLQCPSPKRGQEIRAEIVGNTINIRLTSVEQVGVRLNENLINPQEPISIRFNGGKALELKYMPVARVFCESLRELRDPNLASDFLFSGVIAEGEFEKE